MIILRQKEFGDKYIDKLRKELGGHDFPERYIVDGIQIRRFLTTEPNDKDNNTVSGAKKVWGIKDNSLEPFAIDEEGNLIAKNNKTNKIVLIDHKTNKQLVIANSSKEFESKLYSDFDSAAKEIYDYMKRVEKTKLSLNDIKSGLDTFDEDWNNSPEYIDIYFQGIPGTKLDKAYSNRCWVVRKYEKTGKMKFLKTISNWW